MKPPSGFRRTSANVNPKHVPAHLIGVRECEDGQTEYRCLPWLFGGLELGARTDYVTLSLAAICICAVATVVVVLLVTRP